jgi:TRAP-type C4-dicarboxylate transport system substrate-binding protein
MPIMKRQLISVAVAAGLTLATIGGASAETVLRASHQFPGGKGDVRDEIVQLMAKEVKDANVDLAIQVYPGQSLFKAKEQWGALVRGRLDMTSLPLDYASGRHPEFSATLMPGLVRSHERAQRLNDSKFMDMIKRSSTTRAPAYLQTPGLPVVSCPTSSALRHRIR